MKTIVNVTHGCASGGGAANGLIPVQRKASSACCGAKLDRGPDGYICKGCGKPCARVMSDPVAHWTCTCGQKRHQQVTWPQDGDS